MKMVLFDIDGTLIRTGGAGVRALDRAFQKHHGVANPMGLIQPAGKTDPAIIREIFHIAVKRDCTANESKQMCRSYLDFLKEEIATAPNFRVMPGIAQILRHLSASDAHTLGLVTGNLEEGARIKLARPDLNKYFRFGGYGSDSENRPQLTRVGIERGRRFQNHPSHDKDIFLVGDTPFDIDAGKQSGVVTIAVATGPWKLTDLKDHTPDYAFENLEEYEAFFRIVGL